MSTGSSLHQRPFDLDENDFFENPEPRCPVILLLDTSQSMAGNPIKQLNEGLQTLKRTILKDDVASKRVEIAVVAFGEKVHSTYFQFASNFEPSVYEAKGRTPMGEAIRTGLRMIEDRKRELRGNVQYFRPQVFLITDGAPTDEWRDTISMIREGERAKRFLLTAIGVNGADFAVLNELINRDETLTGERREALRLDELKFGELFRWLSDSVKASSIGIPGDDPKHESPTGWAVI